jgi:hypothetical protein
MTISSVRLGSLSHYALGGKFRRQMLMSCAILNDESQCAHCSQRTSTAGGAVTETLLAFWLHFSRMGDANDTEIIGTESLQQCCMNMLPVKASI